jgi:IS605 OrfB family transposase
MVILKQMTSILTYKYRIKDATTAKTLQKMSRAVNFVWNYCNATSKMAWQRDRRWLSEYDMINLTVGCGQELQLHSHTIQKICGEHATRRKQAKQSKLRWRSKKRSLGWIPFKANAIKVEKDRIRYNGHWFRLWLSRPVDGTIKEGSFSQDARGRWYVNLQCAVEDTQPQRGGDAMGIDLGLKDQATLSDGQVFSRENLTQQYAERLATAQRARHKRQARTIHAKIANKRKDWAHKTSKAIVEQASAIYVGNVSSSKLVKTKLAKSVSDAGWAQLRAFLQYKAIRLGVTYADVNEAFSTVTCSGCGARTGPRGLSSLGVRSWRCSACGEAHNRDVNAARNILRVGLGCQSPEGIPHV